MLTTMAKTTVIAVRDRDSDEDNANNGDNERQSAGDPSSDEKQAVGTRIMLETFFQEFDDADCTLLRGSLMVAEDEDDDETLARRREAG